MSMYACNALKTFEFLISHDKETTIECITPPSENFLYGALIPKVRRSYFTFSRCMFREASSFLKSVFFKVRSFGPFL